MQAAAVRDASGRVIVALMAAGRSAATIERHEVELGAFAGFLEARGRAVPTEVDCLDFIAERSGVRLAGLREPTSCQRAQLARRPLLLLMETLAGGVPTVGQATTPPVDRCPARFRAARDEYLEACRRRGNAEATVVTKQRAAEQFLAYLEEVSREALEEVQARDLAGFWARRERQRYAPKTAGLLRSSLADFLRHLHEAGQIREDLAGRLPPQRYPRRGQSAPHPWTAEEVRRVLAQIDRQSAIGKRDYAMVLLGGFKRSSQHSIARRLRWAGRRDGHRVRRGGRWIGRRGGRRRGGVSIGFGSGRRSGAESRVWRRLLRLGCRKPLASDGSVRVAGCHQSASPQSRGATCRSLSGRRSRCCVPSGWGCERSPGGPAGHHRRSLGSFAATPGLAAAR